MSDVSPNSMLLRRSTCFTTSQNVHIHTYHIRTHIHTSLMYTYMSLMYTHIHMSLMYTYIHTSPMYIHTYAQTEVREVEREGKRK